VRYGATGVTNFMVSHEGIVVEKDLGPNTDAVANAMLLSNPTAPGRRRRCRLKRLFASTGCCRYCLTRSRKSETTLAISNDAPPCTGGYFAKVFRWSWISTLIGMNSQDTFWAR
jgi:hypothetical protein